MKRARAACALALVLALIPGLSAVAAPSSPAVVPAAVPAAVAAPATAVAPEDSQDQGVGSTGIEISAVAPVVAAPGEPVRISGTLDAAELGIDLSPPPEPTPTTAPTDPAGDPTTTEPGVDDVTGDIGADDDADDGADEPDPPAPPPVATVEVRLATNPLRNGADVAAWAQSTAPSAGRLIVSEPLVLGADGIPADPATRIPFTVTVDDLRPLIPTAYGVVPISIQVYLPGEPAPVRVVHTFLGFEEMKQYAPLGITVVLPFTLPADPVLLGPFGEDRATAWETLLAEDARLTEQLALGSARGVAWAVDPTLLTAGPAVAATTPDALDPEDDPTSTATDADGEPGTATDTPTEATDTTATDAPGIGTTGADGTAEPAPVPETLEPDPTPGPAARERMAREAYVQRMLEAVRGRDVLLLPVGDADLAALPEVGTVGPAADAAVRLLRSSLEVEQARTLLEDAGATVQPMVWPADGVWSAGQDELLRSWPEGEQWGVLAAEGSLDGDAGTGPLVGTGGSPLVGFDDGLSARSTAAIQDAGPVLGSLTLMADTLMTLDERPGTARHRVIVLDRESTLADVVDLRAPLRLLTRVPWLDLDPLPPGEGSGGPATSPRVDTSDVATTVLTEDTLVRLGDTETWLDPAAALRVNTGEDLATRGRDTLDQLLGSRWRGAGDEWEQAYAPLADQVDSTFTSIHIPARDIAFLADSGLVRVTVENSLDDGLRNATMELSVDHPILRIESGPQPVDVGADSRSTVSFQASAISSGRVAVTAVVRSEDGTVLGEPTTFTVRVSPTSDWIYWLLGGLAGVVILIGIVRTVLRRHPGS